VDVQRGLQVGDRRVWIRLGRQSIQQARELPGGRSRQRMAGRERGQRFA
jgi:hypothetical protein